MSRAAGILMPITSLPGKYGIGCFSKEAYAFIDWLKEAGQTYTGRSCRSIPPPMVILPTNPSLPLRVIPTLLIWKN